jgi:hypothetical protein
MFRSKSSRLFSAEDDRRRARMSMGRKCRSLRHITRQESSRNVLKGCDAPGPLKVDASDLPQSSPQEEIDELHHNVPATQQRRMTMSRKCESSPRGQDSIPSVTVLQINGQLTVVKQCHIDHNTSSRSLDKPKDSAFGWIPDFIDLFGEKDSSFPSKSSPREIDICDRLESPRSLNKHHSCDSLKSSLRQEKLDVVWIQSPGSRRKHIELNITPKRLEVNSNRDTVWIQSKDGKSEHIELNIAGLGPSRLIPMRHKSPLIFVPSAA